MVALKVLPTCSLSSLTRHATTRDRYLSGGYQNYAANGPVFCREHATVHENELLILQVQYFIVNTGGFLQDALSPV